MIIETITKEELKIKIERHDNFKLIFTMGEWHFQAMRIPGSIYVPSKDEAMKILKPEDEIIVYCSSPSCLASQIAYKQMKKYGLNNVKRYAGGISEWQEAGYPVEGDMVE